MSISGDYLVISELEDTLIARKENSFAAAKPALEVIKSRAIPLIICSNKTRAEIELWQKRLSNKHPFICENGGAAYIPPDYFSFGIYDAIEDEESGYSILEMGAVYDDLVKVLNEIKNLTGYAIKGFFELTAAEIAKMGGISQKEAELAKDRHYDEAFFVEGELDKEGLENIRQIAAERKLRYYKGRRFHHLSGDHDKGGAVSVLKRIYRKAFPRIKAIGVGSHEADAEMLRSVEIPILIKNPSGGYAKIDIPDLRRSKEAGPEGWAKEIGKLIKSKK